MEKEKNTRNCCSGYQHHFNTKLSHSLFDQNAKTSINFILGCDNFLSYQLVKSNFSKNTNIFQNCDLFHNFNIFSLKAISGTKNPDKSNNYFTSIGSCDTKVYISKTKAEHKAKHKNENENFSQEKSDQEPSEQKQPNLVKEQKINFIGCLPKEQLKANLTPTKKIFLAYITKLCSSQFAKTHSGSINLSNYLLAKNSYGLYSPRQIQRHLDVLTADGFITVKTEGNTRWISLRRASSQKFMPFIICSSLTPSQNLVLSHLLEKAAFYARGGLGFVTDKLQMQQLEFELYPLSARSIRAALQSLKKQGLISYVSDINRVFMPVTFAKFVADTYRCLCKITISENCQKLLKKRAVVQILSGNNALSEEVKRKRKGKDRIRQGFAEEPQSTSQLTAAQRRSQWNELVASKLHLSVCPKLRLFELAHEHIFDLLITKKLLAKKGKSHNHSLANCGFASSDCWQKKTTDKYKTVNTFEIYTHRTVRKNQSSNFKNQNQEVI